MLDKIIKYSIRHKLIVLLLSLALVVFGSYSLTQIPIGAVPDVTNNQVQIITTSRNLATEDVEKFLTYPVELEMANLPEVKEIRSISKFGLSVVTVVFTDKIGTYLPRQLIEEKLKAAEEKIPTGFGKPFMGPITTGLGEIYQYVIDVEPKYRDRYSLTDLRTIQDWVIKRQLSGIPGVVEINTWGGYLKQYEVAVNPERLRSLDISLSQVYEALSKNNNVAGGGYIEKSNETYFVRGEGLVNSLESIENIVITNRNGTPFFIKDIGEVGYGHATRFGAVTGNGEGEKVLGQVMMLKDANSNAVIEAVKKRVAEISPSLPPGVSINPFLERSELIAKTTTTIAENLILGCLIVIFVVVLLLGNLRSGLVVASVIPLCLLFALSMMHIFHVDANLMSLGAIDFGIIIDGAVIIVEYIAYKFTQDRLKLISLPKSEKQAFRDETTYKAASKMMRSAVFGQLIIIIVFIPILSLVGVEGKMFRPMALVFCFALIGAMILCFTYVPVMSSLFIQASDPNKKTISSRLVASIEGRYKPVIQWALHHRSLVLSFAAVLFILVVLLFSRMGGEFVPTLDEGDFVIQPILKTGTSLSSTVEYTARMEKILKKFPEVDQVVSRIGAAEVPTDPMSMEESDVIIKLKPKSDWVSADSKDELADTFKSALSEIPGIDYEFTQPIEMRFNELITGVRADLAIKIFGEDMDILYKKALEIEKKIRNIEGAADISVEKVAGLPQMSVKYNREKIAQYGLNIEDLNKIVSAGFAGTPTGMVFEGEKQFDLVLRFDKEHASDIQDLENATIILDSGEQMPLSEFASITYTKGPAKISRDNTKRRIVVGVNVRGRDLESVVKDAQQIIESEVKLPVGYEIAYGGQFENLRTARARLMIAVPIALILIFIMLYFAFSSVREALMIYSAIPMSAIGGVILLWLRGMPFSISAGVGFIALFGIAVLNGIVLIEEFKELKEHGIKDINKRILMGTKNRLRPVLLTASAAALGFLPMAISTSAGAEVQRPLATVVVGGLISATALTLIVLPVLYALFDDRSKKSKARHSRVTMVILLVLSLPFLGRSQNKIISAEEAVRLAIENNQGLHASALLFEQSKQLISSAVDLDKTEIYYNKDNNNIAPNDLALNVLGVNQSVAFPTIYRTQRKVLEGQSMLASDQYDIDKHALTKEVLKTYYELAYWQKMKIGYTYLDSLYGILETAAQRKYEEGESNRLEKLTAQSKRKEVTILLNQADESINKASILLNQWMQTPILYTANESAFVRLELLPLDTVKHPSLAYYLDALELNENQIHLEKQKLLPDFNLNYFNGYNNGAGKNNYGGFQVGVAFPIWGKAQKARIEAAKTNTEILNAQSSNQKLIMTTNFLSLISDMKRYEEGIKYYENSGKELSKETIFHAIDALKNGEIDYFQYIQLLDNAKNIETNYLSTLLLYNMTVIEANYLIN